MQTQDVFFRYLHVVEKKLESMEAFFQDRLKRVNGFGSKNMSFSVRRGSYRSIILETV